MIREKTRKIFAVSVELGTPADGTAIAVVELVHSPSSPTDPQWDQPNLHLRHLKRFPPGTLFKNIADGLLDLLDSTKLNPSKDVDVTVLLVVDQTVVRSSVMDQILKTVNRPDGWRVFIGGSHSQGYSDGCRLVSKPELISCLQAGMGWDLLKFPKALTGLDALVEALINYQDRKTNAMLLADAWREHQSDDLVFAVALACWRLKKDIRFSCDWM
jgi:hypothetical protein